MTECTQTSFTFANHARRQVVARFDGGTITSDGGAVLLRQLEQRTGIVRQFAACFRDHRQAAQVEHSVRELVAQRVYGLALGYEDLNDHDQLRCDPLLALLSGKQDLAGAQRRRPLAQPPGVDPGRRFRRVQPLQKDRSRADRLLTAHPIATPPTRAHRTRRRHRRPARPAGRFFHGYYGHYCYLPLYIFPGTSCCARACVRPISTPGGGAGRSPAHRRDKRVWPRSCFGRRFLSRRDPGARRTRSVT